MNTPKHSDDKIRYESTFKFCAKKGCRANARMGSDYCGRHQGLEKKFQSSLSSMSAHAEDKTQRDGRSFKMLNGHCVPVSTPDNYFALSAALWLKNLGELVKASRSQQAQNVEREQARIEFDANDNGGGTNIRRLVV